tara:strand:+ start:24 stop:575 length:552 start_codon:yes stop_codon:yes gene_type:complete
MIKCSHLEIDGLLLFESKKYDDSRGSFSEVYRLDQFSGFLPDKIKFVQDNESFSNKGVLRGLHFQESPFEQSKLVRVSHGKIQDVVVDIRKNSKTFGKHISLKLSKENGRQLFVPKGFAHGFLVLSNQAIVNYKVDNYYSKEHDSGILFNDSDLNINWELDESEIEYSKKDLNLPQLKNLNIL